MSFHCPSYLEDVQADNGKWNSQNPTEKKKNPVKIWAQDTNSSFAKEDIEMTNKDTKTLSRPLSIKQIQSVRQWKNLVFFLIG